MSCQEVDRGGLAFGLVGTGRRHLGKVDGNEARVSDVEGRRVKEDGPVVRQGG